MSSRNHLTVEASSIGLLWPCFFSYFWSRTRVSAALRTKSIKTSFSRSNLPCTTDPVCVALTPWMMPSLGTRVLDSCRQSHQCRVQDLYLSLLWAVMYHFCTSAACYCCFCLRSSLLLGVGLHPRKGEKEIRRAVLQVSGRRGFLINFFTDFIWELIWERTTRFSSTSADFILYSCLNSYHISNAASQKRLPSVPDPDLPVICVCKFRLLSGSHVTKWKSIYKLSA